MQFLTSVFVAALLAATQDGESWMLSGWTLDAEPSIFPKPQWEGL